MNTAEFKKNTLWFNTQHQHDDDDDDDDKFKRDFNVGSN